MVPRNSGNTFTFGVVGRTKKKNRNHSSCGRRNTGVSESSTTFSQISLPDCTRRKNVGDLEQIGQFTDPQRMMCTYYKSLNFRADMFMISTV